jgi:hypothetical protein
MGGLFSSPKVQEPPKAATDAQDAANAQAEADRKRKARQLAAQKRAATYGGQKSLLYAGREDPQLGVPTGSGALGSSVV